MLQDEISEWSLQNINAKQFSIQEYNGNTESDA